MERAGAEQAVREEKGRERRRELGHRAGQNREGEEEKARSVSGLGWKRRSFSESNSFLFLVFKSKPNSNEI